MFGDYHELDIKQVKIISLSDIIYPIGDRSEQRYDSLKGQTIFPDMASK